MTTPTTPPPDGAPAPDAVAAAALDDYAMVILAATPRDGGRHALECFDLDDVAGCIRALAARVTAAEAARAAAEAQRAALAGAVLREREAHAAAWEALAATDRERDRAMNQPRHAPVEFDRGPLEAARAAEASAQETHAAARKHLDALLTTPAPAVVRADVVRAYLDAVDVMLRGPALWDHADAERALDAARTALDAALAAAGAP